MRPPSNKVTKGFKPAPTTSVLSFLISPALKSNICQSEKAVSFIATNAEYVRSDHRCKIEEIRILHYQFFIFENQFFERFNLSSSWSVNIMV